MAKGINQTLDETSGPDAVFRSDLRGEVLRQLNSGRSCRDLAPSMHPKTVWNFAHGVTAKPSSLTIKILAESVGYKLIFVPINTPRIPGQLD